MYIMQNSICWEIRSPFNLRLKNHREDVDNMKAVPACDYFRKQVITS